MDVCFPSKRFINEEGEGGGGLLLQMPVVRWNVGREGISSLKKELNNTLIKKLYI